MCRWRKGYTDADIERVFAYGDPITPAPGEQTVETRPDAVQEAARVLEAMGRRQWEVMRHVFQGKKKSGESFKESMTNALRTLSGEGE